MKGNFTNFQFRIDDEECFETIIDDEDDIVVDSSKNSDNINEDGSDIEIDDVVDEALFDNNEDESDLESENELAEELFEDDLPGVFKKLSKKLNFLFFCLVRF